MTPIRWDVGFAAIALAGLLFGCAPKAGTPKLPPAPPAETPSASGKEIAGGPTKTVEPTLVTAREALGLSQLLREGHDALQGRDAARAEQKFRHALFLIGEDPPAALSEDLQVARTQALFGLATALDLSSRYEQALAHYADVAAPPVPRDQLDVARQAQVRSLRILLHLERYERALDLAETLEAGGPLLDELTVRGARALGRASRPLPTEEDWKHVRSEVALARELIESSGYGRLATPPVEAAVVFFAQGEWERHRALTIRFDPNVTDFTERLEQRCRHLLDAQAAYSEVMRSKNAHWSAMAGVRVGELYYDLHEDLMAMGPPRGADSENRQLLYWGAMRLRYGILLEKAVHMMERTLEMLDRTGEPTRFRALAEESLVRLQAAERAEEEALAALPYSRDQLRAVLRDLSLKSGGSGKI